MKTLQVVRSTRMRMRMNQFLRPLIVIALLVGLLPIGALSTGTVLAAPADALSTLAAYFPADTPFFAAARIDDGHIEALNGLLTTLAALCRRYPAAGCAARRPGCGRAAKLARRQLRGKRAPLAGGLRRGGYPDLRPAGGRRSRQRAVTCPPPCWPRSPTGMPPKPSWPIMAPASTLDTSSCTRRRTSRPIRRPIPAIPLGLDDHRRRAGPGPGRAGLVPARA